MRVSKPTGRRVFVLQLHPQLMCSNAARRYPGLDAGARLEAFEHGIINVQLAIEEAYRAIARCSGRKSVVIHDRALLDIAAYVSSFVNPFRNELL